MTGPAGFDRTPDRGNRCPARSPTRPFDAPPGSGDWPGRL